MSTSQWKNIWEARKLTANGSIQEKLIRANGFDSGAEAVDVNRYTQFVELFSQLINLEPDESVFEVGCGSGAFLHPLRNIKKGGLDYSKPLIEIAKGFIPNGDFICDAATNLNTDEKYDHVFAHSVFQYLSLDQAKIVLSKMIQKSRKTVSILDIPNIEKRSEQEEDRKLSMGENEYNLKYQDLVRTYYPMTFFDDISIKHSLGLHIVKQSLIQYRENDWRYMAIFSS